MDHDIEHIVDSYEGPHCLLPSCRKPLGASPSRYFCSEDCQHKWCSSFVDPKARPYDEVMDAARRSERLRGPWWAAGGTAA